MMDEIRGYCARLLSDDFATHSAAYRWLRDCEAFRRVVEQFREHGLTLFDVAAMLAPGSDRALAPAALKMLADALVAEKGS